MNRPIVLSLFDGFFMGGSRIVHTEIVRALDATTEQRHSVLALTNRVYREQTLQLAQETASYKLLSNAGVPVLALDRDSDTAWSRAHRTTFDQFLRGSDVILSLKEQPLAAITADGTYGKPLLVTLHRSDPQNDPTALDSLISLTQAGVVSKAVCCADATLEAYCAAGVPRDKLVTVPNGVDLRKFQPSEIDRQQVRTELAIEPSAPVIVMAARFDPIKNVEEFIAAAAHLLTLLPSAHFIMCGTGMVRTNADLSEMLGRHVPHEYVERFHCLGLQTHMARYYNAADIVALTSLSEAAPLCLLEGMACGAIPVSTDVGDAARMVEDPRLISGYTSVSIAETWAQAWEDGAEHRDRIRAHRYRLSDQHMFDAYSKLIEEALA